MENHPRVGVGVIIKRDNSILLGERLSSHGRGTYAPPGGHLELYESFQDCAMRESIEETGLKLYRLKHIGTTNDIFRESSKHYITIFMSAEIGVQDPRTMEPEKCKEWKFYKTSNLPRPLFLPMQNLIKYYPEVFI